MKIKTRLRLNAFISLGVLILILFSIAWSFREMSRATSDMDLVEEMRKVAFERVALRDDYLLYREERARTQWHAKSETLRGLLETTFERITGSEDRALVIEARKDFNATFSLFSQFMEDQKREGGAGKKGFDLTEADSRLIGQVFLKAYALSDSIGRLHESALRKRTTARNIGALSVIVTIIGGVFAIFINSAIINRILAKRITALGNGIEIIGAGDLDYRIGVEGDDELTALALASNDMAAKLKGSYTSVENLQKEIAQRIQAEDGLRASEELYRHLFDNMLEGFAYCRMLYVEDTPHDLIYLTVNSAFETLTGLKNVTGKKVSEVIPGIRESDPGLLEMYGRVAKTGKSERFEIYVRALRMWFSISVYCPEPECFVAVFDVITERKRAEEELRKTNEYLDSLINYANAPIIVWDPLFRITRFNHAFEALTGRQAADVIGNSLEILFPRDKVDTSMELISKTLGGERWESIEINIIHLDGSIRIVLWNSATIFATDGITPVATIAQGHDITERKRVEEALRESEVRFQMMVESVKDYAIITLDSGGHVMSWNAGAERIKGYRPEEIIGQHFSRFFPREDKESGKFDRELAVAAAEGRFEDEGWRVRKDGSRFIANVVVTSMRDDADRLRGFVIVTRDITERKQMAEALTIQARIATIFLTAPDDEMFNEVLKVILEIMQSPFGVFGFIDEAGALVVPTMTRQIWDKCQVPEKTKRFPREEWGCSSWSRALREKRTIQCNDPSTNIPEGHVGIQRHISLPILFRGEAIGLFQVANKKTDYTEADIRTLGDIAGHVASILNARFQHWRAEEQLKRTMADLERSNKELEQFAYVASHDLQEPLRMVASYTQLLAQRYEGQLDDKARKYIDYAVDGAVRMQRLINDLLAYSRVNTQGKTPEMIDSHSALSEALRNLSAAIEENRAIVSNDDLPIVRADATQMMQLFQNLIGNAIMFRGAELPRIQVSASDLGREWRFSVKDNGIGIDAQYADKVFLIFQRLHTRQEYPGTGIGLAICKRIAERHGGRIWFDSEAGNGSTFYFTLPK